MSFVLDFTDRFRRQYQTKTRDQQEQINNTLRKLATDPRTRGLQTHKIQGADGIWECYIHRGWRITFEYGPQSTIILRNNCSHEEVLRRRQGHRF